MKKKYLPVARPIITYGDATGVLLAKAKEISPEEIRTEEVQQGIVDLVETCRINGLIGIAAPQIGWSKRVIVLWTRPTPTRPDLAEFGPIVMVNPRIDVSTSHDTVDWEGCGSLPEIMAKVSRPDGVEVSCDPYEGRKRRRLSRILHGLLARVVQHEIDHLDGVSFLERANLKTVITLSHYKRLMEKSGE